MDGRAPATPPPDEDLARLREIVEQRAGLVLDDAHGSSLAERVVEMLAEEGLASTAELLARISGTGGSLFDRLMTRLTVKETYFFRNRPQFRALREVLLPELLERASWQRRLRIWSAGCSTGEEPYSLAMVLSEVAADRGIDLAAWDVEIHGTDINPDAIEKARAGVYGRYSFRGVEADEIARHFDELGSDEYEVKASYRKLVRFGAFNLKSDRLPDRSGPFHELDLIVCRNVTIYFSTETTRSLADRFFESLREGGYLIVGHSEHSLETYRRFETHALPDSIHYRRGGSRSLREIEGRDVSPIGQALHSLRNAAAAAPGLVQRARSLESRGGAPAIPRPGDRGGPAREGLPPSLTAARQALGEGDLDRAVAVAVELLESQPDNPDAALLLGELAADRGHVAEAEVWLRHALVLRPLDLTAHYVLALLAAERGERRLALDQLGRALYVDADFLMGHYLSARLQREEGREEAAERSLRTALRICDSLPGDRLVPFSEGLDVKRFRILLEGEQGVIRVVLADDSAVVRDILRNVLESDPGIRVVGEARNGREAVDMAVDLKPDILLMDVRMPVMDGIEATSEIMSRAAVSILVVSAGVHEDTNVAFRAIQAGAIDVVQKPVGNLADDYGAEGLYLIRRVKLVAGVPAIRRGKRSPVPVEPTVTATGRLVALGASTGGPPALATILGALPANFPAPVLAVQHISKGFLQGFVDWLDSIVPPKVQIAERGSVPQPGTVSFAPEDQHLEIGRRGEIVLTMDAACDGHRPSTTTLFLSAARVLGPRAVGVLLTGMGRDGATGLKAMRDAGAATICQDEESSVVFGMPGVAIEIGAAGVVAPVEQIAAEIARALR